MYDDEAVVARGARGGEMCDDPSGMWILTGSTLWIRHGVQRKCSYSRERDVTVLGEHRSDHVDNDIAGR